MRYCPSVGYGTRLKLAVLDWEQQGERRAKNRKIEKLTVDLAVNKRPHLKWFECMECGIGGNEKLGRKTHDCIQ